jgi:hypothetical protein
MMAIPNPSEPGLETPVLEVIVEGHHPQGDLIPNQDWQAFMANMMGSLGYGGG